MTAAFGGIPSEVSEVSDVDGGITVLGAADVDGGITILGAAAAPGLNLRDVSWAVWEFERYAQVRSGPFLGKPYVGDQACRNDQSNKCTSSNSFRAPSSRTMLPCRDPLIANAHARRYF